MGPKPSNDQSDPAANSKQQQQRPGNQKPKAKAPYKKHSNTQQNGMLPRSGNRNGQMDSSDDGQSYANRGRSIGDTMRARSRARSVSRTPWIDHSRSIGRQAQEHALEEDGFIRVPRVTFEGPGGKRFVRVYDDTMHFSWILALVRHRCMIDAAKPFSLVYARDREDEQPVELEDEDDFTGLRALAWEGSDIKVTINGARDPAAQWPAPPLLSQVDVPVQSTSKTPHRPAAQQAPQHSTPVVPSSLGPPSKRQKITSFAGDLAASATKNTGAEKGPTGNVVREGALGADTQQSEVDPVLDSSNPGTSAAIHKRGARGKNGKAANVDSATAETEVVGQKRKAADEGDQDTSATEPKPKRKRRTKAEMEAARSAEAAAQLPNAGTANGVDHSGNAEATQPKEPAAAGEQQAKKSKNLAKEARKSEKQANKSQDGTDTTHDAAAPSADTNPAQPLTETPHEAQAQINPSDSSAAFKKQLEKGCAICLSVAPHAIEACPTILAGRAAVKARVEELKEKKQRKLKPERNAQSELVHWLKEHPASSSKKNKKQAAENDTGDKTPTTGSGPTIGESVPSVSELPFGASKSAGRLLPQSPVADGVAVGNDASEPSIRVIAKSAPSEKAGNGGVDGVKGDGIKAKQTKGKGKAVEEPSKRINGDRSANVAEETPAAVAVEPAHPAHRMNGDVNGTRVDQRDTDSGDDSDTSEDSNEDNDMEEKAEGPLPTSSHRQSKERSATSSSSGSSTRSESSSSSESDSDDANEKSPAREKTSMDGNGKSHAAQDDEEQDELQSQASYVPDSAHLSKAPSQAAPTPWQRATSLFPFGRKSDSAAFSTSKEAVAAPPSQAASQSMRKSKAPLLSELSPAHFRKSSFAGSQPGSPLVTPVGSATSKAPFSQLGKGVSTADQLNSSEHGSSDESDEHSDSDSSADEAGSQAKAKSSVPAARRAGASSSTANKKGQSGFFKAFS